MPQAERSVPLSIMWGPETPRGARQAPHATRMTTNRETRVPVIPSDAARRAKNMYVLP